MKGLQAVMKMQLMIVRAKEFQELMDSVSTLEDMDNEEQDGAIKKKVRIGTQPALNPQSMTNPYFPPENQSGAMTSNKAKNSPRRSTVCSNCGI